MIPWMAECRTLSTPINKTWEYTMPSLHGLSSKQSGQFKIKNHSIYKWEWQDYLSGKLCGKSHKASREINPIKIHWRQQIRTDSKFLINHCPVLVESMLDSKDTVRKDSLFPIQILPKLSSQGRRTPKAKQHGCCFEVPKSPECVEAPKCTKENTTTHKLAFFSQMGCYSLSL